MSSPIIYGSQCQGELLQKVAKFAASSAEILISGPTGVGKELYARYIHKHSPRKRKPFVVVNCANLSSEMIENEVFGHARGAFTGAVTAEKGIAATANGGTLFLDEVDSLPFVSQAKILRFAQLKEFRRLGETFTRKSDVRLIAASSSKLEDAVRAGTFREDLYFRLRVIPIEVPPLAARPDDILPLIDHFVSRYATDYDLPQIEFSGPALQRLKEYPWPGNVRELENCIRYLVCLGLNRPVKVDDMPLIDLAPLAPAPAPDAPASDAMDETLQNLTAAPLKEAKSRVVEGFERMYIDAALEETGGNITAAAERSGKHRRAFSELMRRYGFCRSDYRS